MNTNMLRLTHEFDDLNRWASMPDVEIELIISDETIRQLQRVTNLLGDEHQEPKIVGRENFVSIVREMRTIYAEGSRALGTAIIEASEYIAQQKPVQAQETYRQFLVRCKAKFYRDIAKHQLDDLQTG